MAWPALGAACRIGSTPLTSWIPVPAPEAVPSVERMTTASPLCRSASDVAGARLISRCKSGAPPECAPVPLPPGPPEEPVGRPFWSFMVEVELGEAPGIAPLAAPFKRLAII